jgi:hypothetical protein
MDTRPRVDPRLNENSNLRLGSGGRRPSRTGAPGPGYKIVLCDMLLQQGEVSTSIAHWVFDLATDFAD